MRAERVRRDNQRQRSVNQVASSGEAEENLLINLLYSVDSDDQSE